MRDKYTENNIIIEARQMMDRNKERRIKTVFDRICFHLLRSSIKGNGEWALFVAESVMRVENDR